MAEILWKECANWLILCQVLPPDHRVTWQNAQVIDLAYTLRDGVLLCQLLNKLVPGCIDLKEISLRPQMSQFLCLKNIRTFLQTCQNVFNLKPTDLFELHMLFDYTDFGRVLHTLSLLSKTPQAEATGVRGFPAYTKVHEYYNDDIYRNLEDLANHNEGPMVPLEFPLSPRRTREEDIYEDLCYVTLRIHENFPTVSPVAQIEKRDYCIKELVETEKNYIEALNMIIKHFMRPLKTVISKADDRKIIFLNIKELSTIHTDFHKELYKACTSSQYKISDCFLQWKEKFIIYGEYCSNLPRAQDLVDELCAKNEIINQSVMRCQFDANDGKFKLRDLLSVPMQRILKYHLLLQELIKNTQETHEDYAGLEKALEAMLDLSHYINEVKRDNETLQIIRDIQASITDLDMPENVELKDYGRLLKDGELKIKSHDDHRLKNRYVFVFDKVMLMCKSTRGEHYSYKEALILHDYKVEDVLVAKTGAKDKWCHYWYLVHRENKTVYTMYAKVEDMKRKWIEAIEKALDNVNPEAMRQTDHSFAMHTFEKPQSCEDCKKLLRGILYQGYKCSTCGIAVHKSCIVTVQSCGAPIVPPRPLHPGFCHESEDVFHRLPDSGTNGHQSSLAKAKCAYSGEQGYLSFECDDIIYIIRRVNSTWWKGRLQRTGEEGLFPADHVEVSPSYEDPFTRLPTNPIRPVCNPNDGYVNLNLEEYAWFAGSMDREPATLRLKPLPGGTFLVRISPKQNGSYVISIKYNNQVKHMRVFTTEDGQLYYLSESKYFKSIVELIKWYEENSLSESFNGLNVRLMIPFKRATQPTGVEPIGFAVAIYNFTGSSPSMLSLRQGDKVAILSKAGGEKGWWKGQIEDNIGYFPLTYVQETVD